MKTINYSKQLQIFVFVLFFSVTVNAQMTGISQKDFINHYRYQKESMWCWASSAEMVLSFEGIILPQEAIVNQVKGYIANNPGLPIDIIKSTNCIIKDTLNNLTVISGQYIIGAPLPNVLFNQLKNKRPVILTYSSGPSIGHAIVLTGIDYAVNPDNSIIITKGYFFDPFAYRQIYDPMNGWIFQKDPTLRYKTYDFQNSVWGIQISVGTNVIGLITGVILIEASHLE